MADDGKAFQSGGWRIGVADSSRADARILTQSPVAVPRRRIRSRLFAGLRSGIGRAILFANLAMFALVALGLLLLSETRNELVRARLASLEAQGELIRAQLAVQASENIADPRLNEAKARDVLLALQIPSPTRVRIHSITGIEIADSFLLNDIVDRQSVSNRAPGQGILAPFAKGLRSVREQIREWSMRRAGIEVIASLDSEWRRALAGEIMRGERAGDKGERIASVSMPIAPVAAIIGTVTLESADIDRIIAKERAAVLPYIAGAALLLAGLSILLAYLVAVPILSLAKAAEAVASGAHKALRIDRALRRKDEIGDLASSLQAMIEALQRRSEEYAREAVNNAHELKNPANAIGLAADRLAVIQDDILKQAEIGNIRDSVRRLLRIIEGVTNLARYVDQSGTAPRAPTRIFDLLAANAEIIWGPDGESRGVRINLESEPGLESATVLSWNAATDMPALRHVFHNIVDNALSFSPPESTITIRLARSQIAAGRSAGRKPGPETSALVVTVDDQGPGIHPADLENIFKRFQSDRPSSTSTAIGRQNMNSGIGLDIARTIVNGHGGKITAENRVNSEGQIIGARFVVVLPENVKDAGSSFL